MPSPLVVVRTLVCLLALAGAAHAQAPVDYRLSFPDYVRHLMEVEIVFADVAGNVQRAVAATRRAAAGGASLVAFAELAFTPFYPQRPAAGDVRTLAEPVPGPTTDVFTALARELGIVVVLNLFERDGDRTFDCSPVIDADGTLLGRTRMVHITEYSSDSLSSQ